MFYSLKLFLYSQITLQVLSKFDVKYRKSIDIKYMGLSEVYVKERL